MSEFEFLRGPVRWIKSNASTVSGRGSLKSVVTRRPEVMVKITGCSKSYTHAGNALQYVSRDGKLTLETDRGEEIINRRDVSDLGQDWLLEDAIGRNGRKPRANRRVATSMIFSMPEGTSASKVKNAVRELAGKEFGDKHRYALALHTDTKHPHVHLVIHNRGLHGQRNLHLSKDKLQELRASFAKNLERHGIEAAASPRQVRGKTQKAERTGYYRVKERLHAKGQRTEVEQARIKEAYAEQTGTRPKSARPWESRANATQQAVKKTWLEYSRHMATIDRRYAAQIVDFVQSMPARKTRREELDAALSAALQRRQQQQDKNYNNKPDKPEEREL